MKVIKNILLLLCIFILSSCDIKTDDIIQDEQDFVSIANENFCVYNDGNFDGVNIYAFKNQSDGQILSIAIKTKNNKLIVFDGGRQEDSNFLKDFISEVGEYTVDSWFITHCHDDHVGAIYDIMTKHKNDITINNLYYKFPTFEWLYQYEGNDAGIVNLLEYCFNNYGNKLNIHNDIRSKDIITIDNISIEIMNDLYLVENDSLNNSSIVYKIYIPTKDSVKTLIILGDLSYDGGNMLLNDRKNDLKSDFCAVAHHGQSGVWKEVYESIKPAYCIWCTNKKIYENVDKKYRTDETKRWLKDIGVLKNYVTLDNSILIK